MKINADKFTVNNEECIPTGEIISVEGTPLDFRDFKPVEPGLMSDNIHIKCGNGYDHNFVLNISGEEPGFAAELLIRKPTPNEGLYDQTRGTVLPGNYLTDQIIGKAEYVITSGAGYVLNAVLRMP